MIIDSKFQELFGIKTRNPEEEITQTHCNMALAIQKVTEEIVIKMVKEVKKLTNFISSWTWLAKNCFYQLLKKPE